MLFAGEVINLSTDLIVAEEPLIWEAEFPLFANILIVKYIM